MAELIGASTPDVVERACNVLVAGGTVVLPTETVYGIAALPSRPDAVEAIFELKQRPPGMHLAVLVSSAQQVAVVSTDERHEVTALMSQLWPGPLTLILRGAREGVAHLGSDDGTVGVRSPDHPLARAIAERVGPIASTSANLHGQPTPSKAREIAEQLAGATLVIDAGSRLGGTASTVVDVTGSRPIVIRRGPISEAIISQIWENSSVR